MKSEADTLLEQIHTAFPKEPISADGAFGPAGTTYPDAAPYMEQLEGKTWDQLDREYIVRRNDALGFLTTRHLSAVLPVYLCAAVEESIVSSAAGILTLILQPPRREKSPEPGTPRLRRRKHVGLSRPIFHTLTDSLSGEQRAVVACVLRELFDKDPDGSIGESARTALEDFWKTYLPAVNSRPSVRQQRSTRCVM